MRDEVVCLEVPRCRVLYEDEPGVWLPCGDVAVAYVYSSSQGIGEWVCADHRAELVGHARVRTVPLAVPLRQLQEAL